MSVEQQPSPDAQVQFLLNIQRLLNEGLFTASYKYALLLALADIAVESGDDLGAVLTIPVARIAEKYIQYYWRHAAPYPGGTAHCVLRQNTDRQAAIVVAIEDARRTHPTLSELRADHSAWSKLVRKVTSYFWEQPLWRLQRVGNEVCDFLYPNCEIGTRVTAIELRPGVAFCLRRFHAMLTQMIRGAWVAYVRRVNGPALGTTADLEEFLFGSERADLSEIRPALIEIQNGRCFYCSVDLGRSSAVDHFIPWSRYPVDLGHNFVLAHERCNSAKGSMLAAEEHLGRWSERNQQYGRAVADYCDRVRVSHNLQASNQIATWAYGQAFYARGLVWERARKLKQLTDSWLTMLWWDQDQM